MATEAFPPAPEKIDGAFELAKPTFDKLIRRMTNITQEHTFHASEYTAAMLEYDHEPVLSADDDPAQVVGRRWQFPLDPRASREKRYQVTVLNTAGQWLLNRAGTPTPLVATYSFETQVGENSEGGEFSVDADFFDDPTVEEGHSVSLSGVLRLGEQLSAEDWNRLYANANSAGAGLVYYHFARPAHRLPGSSQFRITMAEEIGTDMLQAMKDFPKLRDSF